MNSGHNNASSSLPASTAAREATPESVAPGGSHGLKASSEPVIARGSTTPSISKSITPKEPKDGQGEYFDVSGTANVRPGVGPKAASFAELRPGLASPIIPDNAPNLDDKPKTEIRAGLSQKAFFVSTELLVNKSEYFAVKASSESQKLETTTTTNSGSTTEALVGLFSFRELDEFAVALFVRWLYGGALAGPRDFHSMNHYLCLHVLATSFEIEELKNTVMDLVRQYYHGENMTAPAFRLEYVYANTKGPCLMRNFLVSTAAYRALAEPTGISDSMSSVLKQGGNVAIDFANALVTLEKNERIDVRKGDPCIWHEHTVAPKCEPWGGFEPFEDP